VVRLALTIAPDHAAVSGTETITFTPDLAVDRVVLRLWANSPRARRGGALLTVRRASVRAGREDATTGFELLEPTLVELPVPRGRSAAGRPLTVEVTFDLRLPTGINERFGHRGATAWLGSGQPLLAWERGVGWATDPATAAFAEASTSESFRLADLEVETAAGDTVLATGTPGRVEAAPNARRRHHFAAVAIRDVAVAAGPMDLTTREAAGVPVVVGVTPGLGESGPRIAQRVVEALRHHTALLGPFPFSRLVVPVLPDIAGGIEYPGLFFLGRRQADDATPSHETAHEWFYGLVGDDQGRDPWLDEAFATYVEGLHRGTGGRYERTTVPPAGRNRVGAPMTFWESRQASYFRSVYIQGGAALLRARRIAGAQRFDAAIRCYVNASAHRIARPADLARALAGLPEAVRILRQVGALPSQ
jgi:hypothetical protein